MQKHRLLDVNVSVSLHCQSAADTSHWRYAACLHFLHRNRIIFS